MTNTTKPIGQLTPRQARGMIRKLKGRGDEVSLVVRADGSRWLTDRYHLFPVPSALSADFATGCLGEPAECGQRFTVRAPAVAAYRLGESHSDSTERLLDIRGTLPMVRVGAGVIDRLDTETQADVLVFRVDAVGDSRHGARLLVDATAEPLFAEAVSFVGRYDERRNDGQVVGLDRAGCPLVLSMSVRLGSSDSLTVLDDADPYARLRADVDSRRETNENDIGGYCSGDPSYRFVGAVYDGIVGPVPPLTNRSPIGTVRGGGVCHECGRLRPAGATMIRTLHETFDDAGITTRVETVVSCVSHYSTSELADMADGADRGYWGEITKRVELTEKGKRAPIKRESIGPKLGSDRWAAALTAAVESSPRFSVESAGDGTELRQYGNRGEHDARRSARCHVRFVNGQAVQLVG